MKTLATTLILLFAGILTTFATPGPGLNKKDHPTKVARYQVGAYLTIDKTKLRVNVDKELGGEIRIQLLDTDGNKYLDHALGATETSGRLSLDITSLPDGDYRLKVTNGLEMEVHNVKIATPAPARVNRSIKLVAEQ
ncbi:hypothetical protein [Spirosoma sp.]|uniref:hypothetical protein n=1 Tax=Spirosoma sp. TaxID=1899569 RepID=UPI003B3B7BEA